MKRINSRVCLLIVLLYFLQPYSLLADSVVKKPQQKHAPLMLQTDTAIVIQHQFAQKKIDSLVNSKDFHYDKTNAPGQSFWTIFWRWLWEKLFKNVFGSSESNSFFYYLFISLGIIFLIYILLRVSGINVTQVIRGKADVVPIPYSESLENIYEIDFDNEIDKAISTHNYRLAVRMLYLSSLKNLSEKGIINWQIEKTNNAYIIEIPEGEKRRTFFLLTRQFEYVWYGEFYIDSGTFQNIRSLFQQFKQTL